MKQLNKALIDSLAKGEIAVKNEGGTVEQLKEIIKATGCVGSPSTGQDSFYWIEKYNGVLGWDCSSKTSLPSHSIQDFFERSEEEGRTWNPEPLTLGTKVEDKKEDEFLVYMQQQIENANSVIEGSRESEKRARIALVMFVDIINKYKSTHP